MRARLKYCLLFLSFITYSISQENKNFLLSDGQLKKDERMGNLFLAADGRVVSIDEPISGRSKKSGVSFFPKATFSNLGPDTAFSCSVALQIKHIASSTFVYRDSVIIDTLAPSATIQKTFSNFTGGIAIAGEYTVFAIIAVSGDGNTTNDTLTQHLTIKDPLSGNFNVGASQTYTTLTQAITDLKDVGMAGSVILSLTDNIYSEPPVTISGIQNLSSTNTLKIHPSVLSEINITSTVGEPWGIKVRGVKGVTIDGSLSNGTDRSLTVNAVGTNGKTAILVDSAQKNIIKNLKLNSGAPTSSSSANYSGVWLNQQNTSRRDTGNQVINCEIMNFGEAGIRTDRQDSVTLQSNYIHDWTQSAGSTDLNGIWLNTFTTNAKVLGNVITNIINNVNGKTATGIYNKAGSGSTLLCANNMIAGIRAAGVGSLVNYTRGIWSNAGNANDKYFYNSINLFGHDSSTASASRASGIEFGLSATSPKLFNNIIVNTMTCSEVTASHSFGYYFVATQSSLTSDYNNLYVPTGKTGYDGQNRTTLLNWISSGRDSNSVSGDPKFISSTDLHIQADVRTPVESWGNTSQTVNIIDTDNDGNIRYGSSGYSGASTLGSDLGADEGEFIQAYWRDGAPVSISTPADGTVWRINSLLTPTATFQNVGHKNLQNIGVRFLIIRNITNDTVYNFDSVITNLQLYQSLQFSFRQTSSLHLGAEGTYTAVAKMEGDDNLNDILTATFNVKGPLSGVLTVGNAGAFATLGQAIDELHILGVDSALTFSLIEPSYNISAPIIFDSIGGSSPTNRITIAGQPSILNISGNGSDSAAIRFRGASYITLKQVNIEPQWSEARYGIWMKPTLLSKASHNIVDQCSVRTGATATQSVGYIGILLDSLAGINDTNNRVLNCDITKFGINGISARRNKGTIIEGNTIHDWTVTSASSGTELIGIAITNGSTSSTVKGNLIKNVTSQVPNASITVSGINNAAGSGSSLLCVNNMIINVRSGGTGSSSNFTRGINGSSSANTGDKYFHNTIILSGTNSSSSSGSNSVGFDLTLTIATTSFSIMNNNVYQSMGHGNSQAKSYCIRLSTTNTNWTSNYNNFYFLNAGELGSQFFTGGVVTAGDYSTLTAWKNGVGNGRDVNSMQTDPLFVSSSDGHLVSSRPKTALNNAAVILSEVTTDFDRESRDATPDIGADEVDVVSSIAGKVFRDIDANLATTLDRIPMENWKVYLYNNDALVDSQTTLEGGSYQFNSLVAGIYELEEEVQEGWTSLEAKPGSGFDSARSLSSTRMRVSVSDGDDAVNNNFINAYPGKISARVYTDTDGKFGTSVDRIQKQWVVRIYQDSISASSLVDFTNDTIFTFIGTPGTYIISIADSGSQWVTIGRVENGRSDVIPHITTDTINVVAGLQHDISFIKFLRHSITVRLEEDSDGSFYSSSEDRKGKEWNIRLRSEEPTVAFDTIVVSDSMIVASYLPAGTYTISQSDSVGWNHLGYIINDTLPGVRATDTSLTITVQGGIGGSIVFVNTTVKFDTSKYRTFSQLELSVKSAKLKLKKKKKPEVGFIYPVPNGGNIRDTVLGKVIRKGAPLTFGRAFTNKDSAKKYGWVTVTKGKALEKMLPMTTAGKYYTHVKAMKDPKNSKLNNHLLGELVAFKVNMQASDNLIVINTDDIPGGSNLGDLRYQDSDTTSFFHNQQLRALADFTDSVLTYGKVLEQAGAVINYAMLDTIFSKVNRAFLDTIGTVMEEKDTISYFPLRIRATMKLADNAEFLKRDYTIPPRQPGIALNDGRIPEAFVLEQNYPNPFNPVTTIEFSLPEDALLTLTIYNVLGQEIMKVLENEEYGAGYDYVEFDGSKLSSGVYFYHVKAVGLEKGSTFTDVKKMVVLK